MKRTPRNSCLAWLARREYTRHQLLSKLVETYPDGDTDEFDQVLERLENESLLDEQRFAESLIRKCERKQWGQMRLKQEAKAAGLESHILEMAIRNYTPCWNELAVKAYLKSPHYPAVDLKSRARAQRFLLGRGFSHEQVANALKRGD